MDAYQQLRQRAKQRRDEAIREARSLYDQALKRIELLERSLGREMPKQTIVPEPDARRIMDLMVENMPMDRPFLAQELVELLRDLYPERDVAPKTVRAYLHRLIVRGEIRRVSRPKGKEVLYAAKTCTADGPPDAAAALINVAETVLREVGPMTMLQLTLAIQDRGTRPELKPHSLMQSLGRALRDNQGRFVKGKEGRWSACGGSS
ncbi:MAG: hypothetical protein WD738_06030 [Pirellulales bacterium]